MSYKQLKRLAYQMIAIFTPFWMWNFFPIFSFFSTYKYFDTLSHLAVIWMSSWQDVLDIFKLKKPSFPHDHPTNLSLPNDRILAPDHKHKDKQSFVELRDKIKCVISAAPSLMFCFSSSSPLRGSSEKKAVI